MRSAQFGNTGGLTTRDVYIDKGGAQTTILTPPTRSVDPSLLFDSNLHQPWADEFVVGFRKQFPMQLRVDVSASPTVARSRIPTTGGARPATRSGRSSWWAFT